MINYADTAYYTDTYKGSVIITASFDVYARKATQIIKQYTFGNVDESSIQDEVKMCCCELAEYLYKLDNNGHDAYISSEKVGELSVSYVSGKDAEDIKQSTIKGIIYNWIATTGLLYRGCS
jgi:hypothetical protein